MKQLIKTLAAALASIVLATGAFAQSTVVTIDNEPEPGLIVKPTLPGPLAKNVVFIPYQVENLRILPLAGAEASKVSPRVGHLHITIDDLPWFWADYGQSSTIILGGLPRGQHKVLIEVVGPEGNVLTGQTVTFNTRQGEMTFKERIMNNKKTILITGSSSGIGRAAAKLLPSVAGMSSPPCGVRKKRRNWAISTVSRSTRMT